VQHELSDYHQSTRFWKELALSGQLCRMFSTWRISTNYTTPGSGCDNYACAVWWCWNSY